MFELDYKLTFEDYQSFLRALGKRRFKRNFKRNAMLAGALVVALTLGFFLSDATMSDVLNVSALAPIIVIGVLYVFLSRFGVPWFWRKQFVARGIGQHAITLRADNDLLHTWQNGAQMQLAWHELSDITQNEEQVLLWLSPMQCLIVPHSAFSTPQEAEDFKAFVAARPQTV